MHTFQCHRGPIHALKAIFARLAMATVLLWGAVAFGNVPGLQVCVVRQP